jgi:glycosyltransferase involved in cell wall biosynthesis
MPLESPEIRKILATDAGAIITYSPEVLGTLKKMGFERKSHYIPNFVDTASFSRRGIPCQRKGTRIVSVSRLVTGLDQDIIIRAFDRVHAIVPQATLQIVGYGEMYEPLKRLVTQLKLSGQVSFVGRQTDVRSFLWNSDIFVATNFGYMATLEAWAAGLAVIAPDFGIMKDIIVDGENGILVPPNDPGKLAIAIVRLLKDSKLRETIASNGEKAAEEYDIREVASRIARIYDSLRSS